MTSFTDALTLYSQHLTVIRGYTAQAAHRRLYHIRPFGAYLGPDRASDLSTVTVADVMGYVSHLRSTRNLKPNSLRIYVTSVRNFFAVLHQLGALPTDPAAALSLPPGERVKPVAYSDDDIRAVFAAAADQLWPSRDRLLLALAFFMGLRRVEIARLSVNDVKMVGGVPHTLDVSGKGAKRRRLPIPAVVADLLLAYLPERSQRLSDRGLTSPVLVLSARIRRTSPGMTVDAITKRFLVLTRTAGVEVTSVHGARRTFATRALRRGVHPVVLSDLCGWDDPGTALHYLSVDDGLRRAGMDSDDLAIEVLDTPDAAAA